MTYAGNPATFIESGQTRGRCTSLSFLSFLYPAPRSEGNVKRVYVSARGAVYVPRRNEKVTLANSSTLHRPAAPSNFVRSKKQADPSSV